MLQEFHKTKILSFAISIIEKKEKQFAKTRLYSKNEIEINHESIQKSKQEFVEILF